MKLLLLLALSAPVLADTTTTILIDNIGVEMKVVGTNCAKPWQVVCVESLQSKRTYLLKLNDNTLFVQEAFQLLLERPVDNGALFFYLQQLALGTTRSQIIDQIAASQEYKVLHP